MQDQDARAAHAQQTALGKFGHTEKRAAAATNTFTGGIGHHQRRKTARQCAEILSDLQHLFGVAPLYIVGDGQEQQVESARSAFYVHACWAGNARSRRA